MDSPSSMVRAPRQEDVRGGRMTRDDLRHVRGHRVEKLLDEIG